MGSIKRQSVLTIALVSLITFSLVGVGLLNANQTTRVVDEFEAKILPSVSTALILSESVAQLAAQAPYISDSAKPFQLQGERKQLEQRMDNLKAIVAAIEIKDIHALLVQRIEKLQGTLEELIGNVEKELFLTEDLRAIAFEVASIDSAQSLETNGQQLVEFLISLEDQPYDAQRALVQSIFKSGSTDDYASVAEKILLIRAEMNAIQQRNAFLTTSVRAQSTQITMLVNDYVAGIRKQVELQRQRTFSAMEQVKWALLILAGLMVLGVTRLYFYSYRMTSDLAIVAKDMKRLADGYTESAKGVVDRRDEIGALAKAFQVFRSDAIKMLKVSDDLREQKVLLETIFNQLHDGLSVFSEDGKLVAWNDRYQQIFQLPLDALFVGQSLTVLQELINQQPHKNQTLDQQPLEMEDLNQLRLREAQVFERHYVHGQVVEFRSQPMPQGGFVTLYTDLTERKEVDRQLHQAQKMEVLGQLTSGLAHDFNNLLAAITGNLQLMDQQPNTKYLHRAMTVAEKGEQLVQRLLAFGRKQKLAPEYLQLDELILGMMDLIEYCLGSGIAIHTDFQCGDYRVYVDASQLENSIMNLVLNSSAAMPNGGQISFSTHVVNFKEGVRIKLTVADSGIGIPGHLKDRVLEPFFTTKPVGQGSGLGLSMVFGFAQQSGGELFIGDSREGAEISLILPASLPQTTDLLDSKDTELPDLPLKKNQQVLLVEDDAGVRETIKDQLEMLGLQVWASASAEAALDLLHKRGPEFHLVFTDVNLSGAMNGVELAVHSLKTWPDLPVLFTSALPRDQLVSEFAMAPDANFLPKPFSLAQLAQIFSLPHCFNC